MPRRSAKTMRRRVKSASKKMAQSVRMRRGAPAKKNVPKKNVPKKNVPKKNVPKKKTQKKGSDWHKQVMVVFKEMRQKDPNVQLQDAMKEASRRKKKGVILSPVQSARSSEFSTVSAPKKKKALSPVKSAASSEFSVVSAPKPKKQKTKKKKMTPPPIPPNKEGKKLPSKKKWAIKYNSEEEIKFNNPLASDYLSSGTQ